MKTLQKDIGNESENTETEYFSTEHINAEVIVVTIENTPQCNGDWNELTKIARSNRQKDIILNTNMIQDVSQRAIMSLMLLANVSKTADKKFIICEISSELLSAAVTILGMDNAMALFPLDKTLQEAKEELNIR